MPAIACADAALICSHQRGRGRPPGTFPEPLADDLLPPVAAAFPGQPVGRDDGAVQLHDDREQRALLEERLELGVGGGRVGQQPPLALVGPPLEGDVADDLGRAHDVALVVLYRRDGERHQDAPAVLADALGLEVIDPLPRLERGDDVVLLREAIRRNDQRDVAPDGLRRRVAEHPLGGVIPALDGPVQRLADDGVVGRLHDRRQLAGVHKLFRLLLRVAPLRVAPLVRARLRRAQRLADSDDEAAREEIRDHPHHACNGGRARVPRGGMKRYEHAT